MKNKRIVFITFLLSILLLVSCTNQLKESNPTVKGEGIKGTKTVTLTLNANENYTAFPTASRTIVSKPYAAGNLKFYVYGTNETKLQKTDATDAEKYLGLKEISVTSADGKTGTVDLEIGSYVWKLNVVAFVASDTENLPLTGTGENQALIEYDGSNEDDILENAVLLGRASADLRGENNRIDFVLMPDTLTKKGDVALKIYTKGWTMPDGYTATIGIYDLLTGTEISNASIGKASSSTVQEKTSLPHEEPANNAVANYSVFSVTPGKDYELVIDFLSTNNKHYYWHDDLVVLPGKGNDETIGIPKTILLPPDAPTDFEVSYLEPTSATTTTYTAQFAWTRSDSQNERYYELEIANLGVENDDDDTHVYAKPTSDETWNAMVGNKYDDDDTNDTGYSTLTTTKVYGQNFWQNQEIWVAGSLLKGNEHASAKLVLGNRYFVRIRAVNDAGPSAWTYVDYGSSITTTDGAEANPVTGNPFTSTTLNLYRIKYQDKNVNGKTVTYTSKATPVETLNKIQYYCETPAGVAIWRPMKKADDTTSTIEVKEESSGAYWTYWKGYNTGIETYSGFENLTLIPMFAKKGGISIYDIQDFIHPVSKIKIKQTKPTPSSGDGYLTIADDFITIDTGVITETTWEIEYVEDDDGNDIVYDFCDLYLTKTSVQDINNNAASWVGNLDKDTLKFPPIDFYEMDESIYRATLHYGFGVYDPDSNPGWKTIITVELVE